MTVYMADARQHQQLAWLDDGVLQVLLDSAATRGQLAMLRTVMPRGAASPVHVHTAEDEIFLVLQGLLTCWVGDERRQLGEGAVAFLPRGMAHAYRSDAADTHLLTLCTPGGLEGFFRTAGHDLSAPVPDGWSITPDTMAAALAAHGGRIVGPPKGAAD